MTEFETRILATDTAQLMAALADVLGTHAAIFLTLISGYLVVAYLAGAKLTKLQVSIATAMYFVAATYEGLFLVSVFRAMASARETYLKLNPSFSDSVFVVVRGDQIGLIVLLAAILAPLWFMWSVRHAESE